MRLELAALIARAAARTVSVLEAAETKLGHVVLAVVVGARTVQRLAQAIAARPWTLIRRPVPAAAGAAAGAKQFTVLGARFG